MAQIATAAPCISHKFKAAGRKGLNSRAIIEATRPFEWRDNFPAITQISPKTRKEIEARWQNEILRVGGVKPRAGSRK